MTLNLSIRRFGCDWRNRRMTDWLINMQFLCLLWQGRKVFSSLPSREQEDPAVQFGGMTGVSMAWGRTDWNLLISVIHDCDDAFWNLNMNEKNGADRVAQRNGKLLDRCSCCCSWWRAPISRRFNYGADGLCNWTPPRVTWHCSSLYRSIDVNQLLFRAIY